MRSRAGWAWPRIWQKIAVETWSNARVERSRQSATIELWEDQAHTPQMLSAAIWYLMLSCAHQSYSNANTTCSYAHLVLREFDHATSG